MDGYIYLRCSNINQMWVHTLIFSTSQWTGITYGDITSFVRNCKLYLSVFHITRNTKLSNWCNMCRFCVGILSGVTEKVPVVKNLKRKFHLIFIFLHTTIFVLTFSYCNSKYLYVGFSYPFICMLATCLSSGEAAGSTSTNPCVIGCLLDLFLSITTATTMMINTATLPMAIPTTLPVL